MLFFEGCQTEHFYFYQNAHPVNLFKEKYDIRMNAQLNTGDANAGVGVQAAVAVTEHVSAGISVLTHKNSRERTINGISTGSWNGKSLEVQGGYFQKLRDPFVVELNAGASLGNENHSYTDVNEDIQMFFLFPIVFYTVTPLGNIDLHYQKYFVQPALGISYKQVEVAASLRTTYLNYYRLDNSIRSGYTVDVQTGKIDHQRNYFLCEPGILIRAGWEMLKFQMQYSYSTTLIGSYLRMDHHYFGCGLSLGVSGRKFKKRDKSPT